MKKSIIFFLVFLTSFALAQNPFLSQPPAEQNNEQSTAQSTETKNAEVVPQREVSRSNLFLNNIGVVRYFTARLTRIQASMRRDIEALFLGEKGKGVPLTLLILAFVSFIYGVVHAAGPGHGKVFIGSYMIAGKSSYFDSIKAAIVVVGAHTVSAAIVITVIFAVFGAITMHTTASVEENIQVLSAVLISLVGAFLLVSSVLKYVGKKSIAGCNHSHETKGKSLPALALSVGLIPCPGVTLLILFAINLGRIPAGVVSVVSMALGMIVTISIVGVIFLTAGKSAIKASHTKPVVNKVVIGALSILGSLMILLFGLILLATNL